MKKLLAALLFAGIIAVPAAANDEVSVFSPAFRPSAKTFAMDADVHFQTGRNKDGDSMTDFGSGDWNVGRINMAYGIMDNLSVTAMVRPGTELSFEDGVFYENGNPQIGVNFQAFAHQYIAIDVFAKYGISWTKTKDSDGDEMFNGRNDFDLGAKFSGRADRFSWSVAASADIFLKATAKRNDGNIEREFKSRTDFRLNLAAMFDINDKWSVRADFDYHYAPEQKREDNGETIESFESGNIKDLNLGAVYNVNGYFSVMPYVGYRFETESNNDDSIKIGCKFGIKI